MAKGSVQHLNPKELPQNPAFTNVVVVTGPLKTIYIGGQNAVNAHGEVVGKGDIGAQTEQILHNLELALATAEAKLEHIIKWNIYVVLGQPIGPAVQVFQRIWGDRGSPPLITTVFVAALGNPDFLAEIEAIAVVP